MAEFPVSFGLIVFPARGIMRLCSVDDVIPPVPVYTVLL